MRPLSQLQSLRCWADTSNAESNAGSLKEETLTASEGLGRISEVLNFSRREVPLYPAQLANSLWDWYNYDVLYGDLTVREILENSGLREDEVQSLLPKSIETVRALVSEFKAAAKNGSKEASVSAMTLPDVAPEVYQGNRGGSKGGENIVEFLRRVWMPWIEAGVLSRKDLRRLDKRADEGVANWLRTRELPVDVRIPTRVEAIDEAFGIKSLSAEELKAQMREHERLGAILRRRLTALEKI
jgi:hypothetical protein